MNGPFLLVKVINTVFTALCLAWVFENLRVASIELKRMPTRGIIIHMIFCVGILFILITLFLFSYNSKFIWLLYIGF